MPSRPSIVRVLVDKPKFKGQIQFERDIAELEKRIERGEFVDPLAPGLEYSKIRKNAMPNMTDTERDAVQCMELISHQIGSEILADHLKPVPGNDTKRPN